MKLRRAEARNIALMSAVIFLVAAGYTYAQQSGLVPCGFGSDLNAVGNANPLSCQLCGLIQLAQNVVNFAILIAIPLAAAMFAYGGVLYIIHGVRPTSRETANKIFRGTGFGFIIALTGWLVINTFLVALNVYNGGGFNNAMLQIQCVTSGRELNAQPQDLLNQLIPTGQPQTNTGLAPVLTQDKLQSASNAVATYGAQLCTASDTNCVTESAIMMVENSTANPLTVTTATMQNGQTQTCVGLMQICLDTARTLDSSNANLSDGSLIQKLQDPNYNVQLGNQLYTQCANQFGAGTANSIACFNGGPGANAPSTDCGPSVTKWQCTTHPGNYVQTQNYVSNVQKAILYLNNPT